MERILATKIDILLFGFIFGKYLLWLIFHAIEIRSVKYFGLVYATTPQWGSNSTFDQKVDIYDLLKICKFSKNTPLWSIFFLDDLSILIKNDFIAI